MVEQVNQLALTSEEMQTLLVLLTRAIGLDKTALGNKIEVSTFQDNEPLVTMVLKRD